MRSAIRWLPAFIGTFVLGLFVGSPAFGQATHAGKWSAAAIIVVATMIATAILCAITRGKKKNEKQGGFSYARTGRS